MSPTNSRQLTSDRKAGLVLLGVLLALFLAVPIIAPSASAGVILPGQFLLLDHPDGSISPPPYGLRLDDLGLTLSTELNGVSTVLTWNGGATATITGTLWNNQAAEMWTVDYTLTGVVAAAANLGFTATGGNGSLTDPALNTVTLTGKQDISGSAFNFLADGHRLGGHPAYGDPDTPVARGWVEGVGTNDWLVRATPVPEPGTALLLGAGLAVLSGTSRRFRCARTGSPGLSLGMRIE
jgi:hypothetical protein